MRVRDFGALEKVRAAVDANVDRMLLLGAAGLGKTVSATCAYSAISFRRGFRGVFLDAFTLASARQSLRLGEQAYAVAEAKHAELLILDDLGAEPAIVSSAIPEVIHHRHAQALITIVTSGFGVGQLEQRYGGGIFRRLVEDAEVVEFLRPEGAR
jgi:DNA replication protein DnaC